MPHHTGSKPVGIAPKGLINRESTSISIDGGVLQWGRRAAELDGRTFSYWLERLILAEKARQHEAGREQKRKSRN